MTITIERLQAVISVDGVKETVADISLADAAFEAFKKTANGETHFKVKVDKPDLSDAERSVQMFKNRVEATEPRMKLDFDEHGINSVKGALDYFKSHKFDDAGMAAFSRNLQNIEKTDLSHIRTIPDLMKKVGSQSHITAEEAKAFASKLEDLRTHASTFQGRAEGIVGTLARLSPGFSRIVTDVGKLSNVFSSFTGGAGRLVSGVEGIGHSLGLFNTTVSSSERLAELAGNGLSSMGSEATNAATGVSTLVEGVSKGGEFFTKLSDQASQLGTGLLGMGKAASDGGEALAGAGEEGAGVAGVFAGIAEKVQDVITGFAQLALKGLIFGTIAAAVVVLVGAVTALVAAISVGLTGALAVLPNFIGAFVVAMAALFAAFQPVIEAVGALFAMTKQTFGPQAVVNLLQQRAAVFQLKQAYQSLADAQLALSRAQQDQANATEDANDRVRKAYENLSFAQERVTLAQTALNRSTEVAIKNLRDLRFSAQEAALGEREAQTALASAMAEQRRTMSDANATLIDRQQASESVAQAELALREAQAKRIDSQEQLNIETAKGIAGSDAVRQANDENIQSNESLIDAHKELNRSLVEQQRVGTDTANNLQHLATQVEAAELAIQQQQHAVEAGTQADQAFAQSMAGLSPLAQAFVESLKPIIGTLVEMQKAIQQAFFTSGLTDAVVSLANTFLPLLSTAFQNVASTVSGLVQQFAQKIETPEVIGEITRLLDSANTIIQNVGDGLIILGGAFTKFADGVRPLAEAFSGWFKDAADEFSQWIDALSANGGLQKWADVAFTAFKSLMDLVHSFFNFLIPLFEAAVGPGTKLLDVFTTFFNALGGFVTANQSTITKFFQDIVDGIKPFLDAFVDAGPAFLTISSVIADTFKKLAPILAPLIPLLANMAATFLKAIAPALVVIMPHIVNFAQVLGGALMTALNAIAPQLPVLADAFGKMLDQLAGPLGDVLVSVITLFAQALVDLAPHLPTLVQGMVDMLKALDAILNIPGLDKFVALLIVQGLPALLQFAFIIGILHDVGLDLWNNVLKPLGRWIADEGTKAWNLLSSAVSWFNDHAVQPVITALTWLWNEVLVPIGNWIAGEFTTVWNNLSENLSAFNNNVVQPVIGAFTWLWQNVLVPLGDYLAGNFKTGIDHINEVLGFLNDWVLQPLIGSANWLWHNVFEPFLNFLTGTFLDGWDQFKEVITFIADKVQWLIDHIPSIPSLPDIPGIGGGGGGIGGILGKGAITGITGAPIALGGIFTKATSVIIGEAGPEVAIPLTNPGRAMQLFKESNLASVLARAGGSSLPIPAATASLPFGTTPTVHSTVVNNHVQGSVITERQLVDLTRRTTSHEQRIGAGGLLAG